MKKTEWFIRASLIIIGAMSLSCGNGREFSDSSLTYDTVYPVAADPAAGFSHTYFLFIPHEIKRLNTVTIFVQPNNSPADKDPIEPARSYCQAYSPVAKRLATPLLMPAFPRYAAVYIHSLDYATMTMPDGPDKRVDLQLIAMIQDAKATLEACGFTLDDQIVMNGFSADGMFTNRFTVLHPELIKACSVGACGFPIIPLAKVDDTSIDYPLGLGKIDEITGRAFDVDAYRNVHQFLYVGSIDENFHIDPTYYDTARELLGETYVDVYAKAEELYSRVTSNAKFMIFPGLGHELFEGSQMQVAAEAFLKQELKR